jgi:hypothetical protein
MPIPRSKLVDPAVSRWYHCISRTVRQAFLLQEDPEAFFNRKKWIENRLEELDTLFAVSVGGFSVMDNHMHLLVRLDPEVAAAWSDEEVVRRWFVLYPPRGSNRKPLPPAKAKLRREEKLRDAKWVARARERLSSLSWFMKCLKEPLARLINKAEKCTGAFFEGRFKSIAILDEPALLAVCSYIDLNPVAAGIAAVPEQSEHTSVKKRVEHVRGLGRIKDLQAALSGSVAGSKASQKLEEELWLIPIEDRRRLDSEREGMLESFTLGNYLMLVEYSGRLIRQGKASISAEIADIFDRLGSTAQEWQARLEILCRGRMIGRVIASTRERLKDVAQQLGLHHLPNLTTKKPQ